MFVKIALRNVLRNKRRTAFSLGVIALGVAILAFVIGFVLESINSTKEQLSAESGALQIASPLFFESESEGYEYLIQPEARAELARLLDEDPRVRGYGIELGFAGLVGDERGSTLLVSKGLVPGNPLQDYSELITQGRGLDDDREQPQIIVTSQLAETLEVDVDDWVNVATGTVTGAFGAASAQVVGVFRYNGFLPADQLGFVPLWFAQKVLRTEGADKFVVRLNRLEDAPAVAADLNAALNDRGFPLEARTWQELTTFYDSIEAFWGVFAAFTVMGVFVLAFFSVLEVLTMSFLERTREVGTIRAVGTKRRHVFATFLLEGVVLGLLGGTLGVLLGGGLIAGLNLAGLSWTPPGAIEPVPITLELSGVSLLIPFLTAVCSTLFGTLYPAAKNARLNIVSALSYV